MFRVKALIQLVLRNQARSMFGVRIRDRDSGVSPNKLTFQLKCQDLRIQKRLAVAIGTCWHLTKLEYVTVLAQTNMVNLELNQKVIASVKLNASSLQQTYQQGFVFLFSQTAKVIYTLAEVQIFLCIKLMNLSQRIQRLKKLNNSVVA